MAVHAARNSHRAGRDNSSHEQQKVKFPEAAKRHSRSSPQQRSETRMTPFRPRYSRTPAERMLLNWVLCLIAFAGVAIVSMLFVLMNLYQSPLLRAGSRELAELYSNITAETYSAEDGLNDALLAKITDTEIGHMLRAFEVAKSPVDALQTVYNYWRNLGMDVLQVKKYRVLRSSPHRTKNNTVKLYKFGSLLMEAKSTDSAFDASKRNYRSAFLAYSPPRDVNGTFVYVNYADVSDFEFLRKNNIDVAGRICLVRVGKITKHQQVMNAQARRALGVVFFLSMEDVKAAMEKNVSFPENVWVGDNVLQHGTVSGALGDPLTPGYPSEGTLHRLTVQDAGLPFIPAQPVNEKDAQAIFKHITEVACPPEWYPHLNVPCGIVSETNVELRLTTHNHMKISGVQDIIGVWKGSIEQERLVVVGSRTTGSETSTTNEHRWLAVSQLLLQSVAFQSLRRKGWRPRRSLAFALWQTDQSSALGSTEWVEDHAGRLRQQAVLYVDNNPVTGAVFEPHASPSLAASLREVASMVYPKGSGSTLKAAWTSQNSTPKDDGGEPLPLAVNGHRDDGPFAFAVGVPTLAVSFGEPDRPHGMWPAHRVLPNASQPGDLVHKSVIAAQVGALMARRWADSSVLPYDTVALANWLLDALDSFERRHGRALEDSDLSIGSAKRPSRTFHSVATSFMLRAQEVPHANPLVTCMINDILTGLEKVFTIPRGVPTRHASHRSILYSPEGVPFPGLEDLVRHTPIDKTAFREHLALLIEGINQATELMIEYPF